MILTDQNFKYLKDHTSFWVLQFVKSIGNHTTKFWCLNDDQIDTY